MISAGILCVGLGVLLWGASRVMPHLSWPRRKQPPASSNPFRYGRVRERDGRWIDIE